MAKKKNRGFTLLMIVLFILLGLAIALFVYGSMNNGIQAPKLPGKGVFALRTMHPHG